MIRRSSLINIPFAIVALTGQCAAQEVSGILVKPPFREGQEDKRPDDDLRLARLALGLGVNREITQERLEKGLLAVLATDRFRNVEGWIENTSEGKKVILRLEAWPMLKSVNTDIPKELRKIVKPWLHEIRKGTRPGVQALRDWEKRAHEWLVVSGYPNAEAKIIRSETGDSITVSIIPGQPQQLHRIEIRGDTGRIGRKSILRDLGIKPSQVTWKNEVIDGENAEDFYVAEIKNNHRSAVATSENLGATSKPSVLWKTASQYEVTHRLNRRFGKKNHLFARVDFSKPDNPEDAENTGILTLNVTAGPPVSLKARGVNLGRRQLKEHLGLPNVDRETDDGFFREAERRLTSFLQLEGHHDAIVDIDRIASADILSKKTIKLYCNVSKAGVQHIADVSISGNVKLNTSDLIKAAKKDFGILLATKPKYTPDFIDNCLGHILSYCFEKGYPDAIIADVNFQNQRLNIVLDEGKYQQLSEIIINFSSTTFSARDINAIRAKLFNFIDPINFPESSITGNSVFTYSQFILNPKTKGRNRNIEWNKTRIRWELLDDSIFRLIMLDEVPLIRYNLAVIRSTIQQFLAEMGIESPIVNFEPLKQDERHGVVARLTVPPNQKQERIQRIVLQGVVNTRPEFMRAEMRPAPNKPGINFGQPLVRSSITAARTSLSSLGIFNSIEVKDMREVGAKDENTDVWSPGDLIFRVKERPLWNFSNSLSYDRAVGYQLGAAAQRINLGGTAKTLDFSLRAGDGIINSKALRDFFPTGNPGRSLDVINIGFSDPWFFPDSWLKSKWIANRGLLRSDLSYIKERQNAYLIFRRRFVTSVEWRINDKPKDILTFRFGYRFENVGIQGPDESEMQDAVKSPERSLLSIPFVQLIWDTRDHPFDPKSGGLTSILFETALQSLGTTENSSFIKIDFRQSWNFPVGRGARFGVTSLALRLGAARPTASTSMEMPLSERFFGGGPSSHRGIEPDQLGPFAQMFMRQTTYPYNPIEEIDDEGNVFYKQQLVPIGGQGIALVNLDYRFPLPFFGEWIWGEVFIDSGEVYNRVRDYAYSVYGLPAFPHWRTSAGVGLILRLGGFPIKVEYAWDVRKMLGKKDSMVYSEYADRTRLKNLLISAGFQF